MKVFKISKNIVVSLYLLFFLVTIIMAAVLFFQYQSFLREAHELINVKDSYYQHVEMLKRSLNASMGNSSLDYEEDLDETDDKKKNELMLQETSFEKEKSLKPHLIITSAEPEFELISPDEESRLDVIKKQLEKIQTSGSPKKIIKKPVKVMSVVKESARYTPVRDFNFTWPIDLSKFWLSSLYGPRRLLNGKVSFHYAIDMAALRGTPVKAAAPGRVSFAQYVNGYGNSVVVYHNHRYKTRYAHLDSIAVQVGDFVKDGQVIGAVGDTGFVRKVGKDASHLHFEIYQDGQRVNPLKFLFT